MAWTPLLGWLRRSGLLALLVLACGVWAQELQAIPPLTARVMDQSGTLTAAQRAQLEAQLATFEAAQGTQIVVLLVPSTQPEDIAAYANRVFNTWKPGRAGIGDGLLIVAAMQERKLRIEVGRTLEGAVPDLAAKRIIDEVLTPHFRQGDYAGGLTLAAQRLMGLVRGEGLPAPPQATTPQRSPDEVRWFDLGVLLFIVLPVAGAIMRRILGNKLGTLATGGLVGFVAFAVTASLLIALVAALLAMLLTFLAGTPLGNALLAASQHRHGGHWGGGMGSGGFGGGGGGGFSSGGGGDGAGGGASGGW